MKLSAPYPYFGSKASIADVIWSALGPTVPNFVDATCGSCSVLWARPEPGKIETVNDAFGAISNFLRAVKLAPEAVADAAAWPVDECTMHARHRWLVERMDEVFVERLMTDPEFHDPEIAGWWVWGQSIWIGSGWCDPRHRNIDTRQRPALTGGGNGNRKRPAIGGHGGAVQRGYPKEGVGIFRGRLPGGQLPMLTGSGVGHGRGIFRGQLHRKLPDIGGTGASDGIPRESHRGIFTQGRRADLIGYFRLLADRLQRVRITCGDWTRVATPAVTVSHGLTGVLLDPPYGTAAKRTKKLYAVDSADVAADMRAWCLANGDNPLLRIVLCGYEGEHEDLEANGWRVVAWKARGGYGNQDGENANAGRERLWLSPHCVREEQPAQGSLLDLFARASGGTS